jgi:hypothetical protein
MNDAAGVPSAPDAAPNSPAPQDKPPERGRREVILVGLAVTAYGLGVALGYLVIGTPQVRRLSWALIAACLGFAGVVVLLARSRAGRALVARWAVALVAFMVGWIRIAGVVTWAYSPSIPGEFFFILVLVAFADVFLVMWSLLIALQHDWKVGVLGLVIIGLMWIPVVFGPPETTVRRIRMELAAPSLVKEARGVLRDPSKAKDSGPFIAYDEDGRGRVVGWPRGGGFLGRGPGVVWDPEGVLDQDSSSAHTDDGYPRSINGYACEPIVDDWLFCGLR